MQPYVVKQGEYLAQIAYALSFDADSVWLNAANAPLQEGGRDPNVLLAGDVLYVPEQVGTEPQTQTLAPGSTNAFVSAAPTVVLTVQFSDPALANQSYTVEELSQLTGLSTDASGLASFAVPVTLQAATLSFASAGVAVVCQVGVLNPVTSQSGVLQRLQNLGFADRSVLYEQVTTDELNVLLRFFVASQPGGSALFAGSTSAGASVPPPDPDPTSSATPSGTSLENGETSTEATANGPSSAGSNGGSSASGAAVGDYGGVERSWLSAAPFIAADGTVDAGVVSLLKQAHGC